MQYDDPAGRLTPFEYECLIKHSCFLMNSRSNGEKTAEKGGEMSDTPRTDAAEIDGSYISGWGPGPSGYVGADDMRDLERELSAAQKDAERYRWMKTNVTRILIGWFQVGWDVAIDAAIAAEQLPPHASAPKD